MQCCDHAGVVPVGAVTPPSTPVVVARSIGREVVAPSELDLYTEVHQFSLPSTSTDLVFSEQQGLLFVACVDGTIAVGPMIGV